MDSKDNRFRGQALALISSPNGGLLNDHQSAKIDNALAIETHRSFLDRE